MYIMCHKGMLRINLGSICTFIMPQQIWYMNRTMQWFIIAHMMVFLAAVKILSNRLTESGLVTPAVISVLKFNMRRTFKLQGCFKTNSFNCYHFHANFGWQSILDSFFHIKVPKSCTDVTNRVI